MQQGIITVPAALLNLEISDYSRASQHTISRHSGFAGTCITMHPPTRHRPCGPLGFANAWTHRSWNTSRPLLISLRRKLSRRAVRWGSSTVSTNRRLCGEAQGSGTRPLDAWARTLQINTGALPSLEEHPHRRLQSLVLRQSSRSFPTFILSVIFTV